ncbi:MAG: hypothetical protein E6J91_30065 [Deltaproteobacteria bacterium]|nr:MAG: hypothetical protein E6J91_30065 [Deltaproteobacteria bacterium]
MVLRSLAAGAAWQSAVGGRQSVAGSRWPGSRWPAVGGRQSVAGSRWPAVGGRQSVVSSRHSVVGQLAMRRQPGGRSRLTQLTYRCLLPSRQGRPAPVRARPRAKRQHLRTARTRAAKLGSRKDRMRRRRRLSRVVARSGRDGRSPAAKVVGRRRSLSEMRPHRRTCTCWLLTMSHWIWFEPSARWSGSFGSTVPTLLTRSSALRVASCDMAHGSAGEIRGALDLADAWGWQVEGTHARALLDRELGLLWGLTRRTRSKTTPEHPR